MGRPTDERSPAIPRWLIGLRVPTSEREDVLLDIDDRHREICDLSGVAAGRRWIWRQAIISLLRTTSWRGTSSKASRGSGWGADLKSALRSMARRPVQAGFAVATLGLGIGLTATAFSILYGTVLRGLPFEEAERLVHFERANPVEDRLSMAATPHDG